MGYTRADLEQVVAAAVREAAEDAEPERVEQLSRRVLREFDEGRRAAAAELVDYIERELPRSPYGYPRSDELPG